MGGAFRIREVDPAPCGTVPLQPVCYASRMAWTFLLLAGVCEIGWPIGLKIG
jgi:hypothetical protein